MNSCKRILFAVLVFLGIVAAESRFNRPVVKLADPKQYTFFKLDDNQFPVLEKGPLAVTCLTYRGTKRYYVEVGIVNRSESVVTLQPGFVSFNKPGYSVFLANTIDSATDVWASVAGAFIPTPPPAPTRSTTTYSGTANTFGNMTNINGTSTTTVDNSAAGWHALGQAIAARSYANAQAREQAFAKYLVSFAYEKQELAVQPGKAQIYMFTFVQVKPKKSPFSVSLKVGSEMFSFLYKE